jgi:hypothetical protein
MPESVVKDMVVWHVSQIGYYNYESNHLTFDGLVARGDTSLVALARSGPTMFYAGDYIQQRFTIENSDIQGFGVGWSPSSIGADQEIVNTYMRNYVDIAIRPPWWLLSADTLTMPRTITIRDVRFDVLNVPERIDWLGQMSFIRMDGNQTLTNANVVGDDEVYVYQYNGDPSQNFRVYYNEAKADAVLPQTVYDWSGNVALNGAPIAGLTNAEAWAQYGIAFGGKVAPTTATTKSNIIGLIDPL